jgi:hypothetical protein
VRIQERVDEVVDAALAAGLDTSDFLQMVARRLNDRKRTRRLVAVVWYEAAALRERVEYVAAAVADFDVDVIGISYEELERCSPPQRDEKLARVEWILVSVLETRMASDLVGPYADRIMPINRVVREDVKEFIRKQPAETRFGIISGKEDMLSRTVASVSRLHPCNTLPISASVEDVDGVDRVIRNADVLIIGSLARPYVAQYGPLPMPSVELVYLPDAAALRRLRARLSGSSE